MENVKSVITRHHARRVVTEVAPKPEILTSERVVLPHEEVKGVITRHTTRHTVREVTEPAPKVQVLTTKIAPQPEIMMSKGLILPPLNCCEDVKVLKADMPEGEQDSALEKICRLRRKFVVEKDIAQRLKKRMEKAHKGHWSCVMGSSFGCFVSHVQHEYLQVRCGDKEIILYRSA